MRVLVCDDHALFAESFAALLSLARYEVCAVTHTPDEALAALAQHEIDVCVLDVWFPAGSIFARLPELRAVAPTAHPVLLTAEADPALISTALSAGMRGFVHKSASVTDICATLERVYAGELVTGPVVSPRRAMPVKPPDDARRLARFLTGREREALCHLVQGMDTRDLARSMQVSRSTARSHIQRVLTKLGVHSRLEAANVAVRFGIVNGATGQWLL